MVTWPRSRVWKCNQKIIQLFKGTTEESINNDDSKIMTLLDSLNNVSGHEVDKLADDFYNPVYFSSTKLKKNQPDSHNPNQIEMITQNVKKKTKESSTTIVTNIISTTHVTTTLGKIKLQKNNKFF